MKKRLFLLFTFLTAFALVFAQTVDTTGLVTNPVFDEPSISKMVSAYDAIYGALVIIWGYVGKAFGLKTKLGKNYIFVVLAGGIVMGGVFLQAGLSQGFGLVFSFLNAIGIYDLIFKPAERVFSRPRSGSA